MRLLPPHHNLALAPSWDTPPTSLAWLLTQCPAPLCPLPTGSFLHKASENTGPHAGPSRRPPCRCTCTHHSLPPRTGPWGRRCLGGHKPVDTSFPWGNTFSSFKQEVRKYLLCMEAPLGAENIAINKTTMVSAHMEDFALFSSLPTSLRKTIPHLP